MGKLFSCLLLLFYCSTPARAQQPNLWQSLPLDFNYILNVTSSIPSPSVMYYDSTESDCYIAGLFGKIGDSVCNILKWDGTSYTLLPPSPLHITNCVTRYKGKLYVGGYGYPVNLACWDGHSWTSLDSSNAAIYCFSLYQGKLLVGGVFNNIANSGIGSIAAWDDTSWSDVYDADTLLHYGWTVVSIAEYKNNLYIGGNINVDTPVKINEIARFDGTRWRDVGNFQDGGLDDVRKLLVWQDTLYVAGAFEEANGSPGNGIAKWDGHNWHRLNDGVWQNGGPAITDIKVFNNELYATGWFYTVDGIQQGVGFHGFAKWDGRRWCTLGTKANNVIFNLGRFRDSLYIMGGFDSLNNQPMRYMAKWIGGDYTDSCSQPDTTTGIVNQPVLATKSLSVFPNPATGWLNIQYYTPFTIPGPLVRIAVSDLTGRVIQAKSEKAFTGNNHFRMNTGGLAPGMYFLEILSNNAKSVVKFVKK